MHTNNGCAVLFDVFGTLIFYPPSTRQEQTFQQAKRCGLKVTMGQVEQAFAQVSAEAKERKGHDANFKREADGHTKVYYSWHYRRLLELLDARGNLAELAQKMFEQYVLIPGYNRDPQVVPLLQKLRSAGFKLGVVSNGPRQVHQVLANFRMAKYFKTIVISDEYRCEKPDANIFRCGLHNLDVAAHNCYYVGDIPEADMRGANNAHMTGILIDRQGKHAENQIPCIRIGQMQELASVLGVD